MASINGDGEDDSSDEQEVSPISQMSAVTIKYDSAVDDDVFDIKEFREDCWKQILVAAKAGNLHQLAKSNPASGGEDGDGKTNIVVAVRTRPLSDREAAQGMRGCVEHLGDKCNIIVRRYSALNNDDAYDMNFAYDHAFSELSHQEDVFRALGWKSIKCAFSGYNSSVIAYGQTGSGKSHSMIGTEEEPGLIRRIGSFLFDFMARGEAQFGHNYTVAVTAAEIYNENVRDLLSTMDADGSAAVRKKKRASSVSSMRSLGASFLGSASGKAGRMQQDIAAASRGGRASGDLSSPSSGPGGFGGGGGSGGGGGGALKIREDKRGGVYVDGQCKLVVHSMEEMAGAIFTAIENRIVRATNMNDQSSRSHLIFVIEFTQAQEAAGRQTVTRSKINLIDLAGSERARTSGASGDGLREGANINKSLTTLGRVISTLAEGKAADHVPYRDSKLTYILKDSLGGDSITSMLATVSPSEANYEETVSTLRYAASVKRIKTSASQHLEREASEMVERLQAEVDKLANELKNSEIQAAAIADEHRRAMHELEKARPVKVVRDESELKRITGELGAMGKRAERYRSERNKIKESLDAMEKRADRYRKERKVYEERVKELEKKLASGGFGGGVQSGTVATGGSGGGSSSSSSSSHASAAASKAHTPATSVAAAAVAMQQRSAEVAQLGAELALLKERAATLEAASAEKDRALEAGCAAFDEERAKLAEANGRLRSECRALGAEKRALEARLEDERKQHRASLAAASTPLVQTVSSGLSSTLSLASGGWLGGGGGGGKSAGEGGGDGGDGGRGGGGAKEEEAGEARPQLTLAVDSLREQLEGANARNHDLEKELNAQHGELSALRRTVSELRSTATATVVGTTSTGGTAGGADAAAVAAAGGGDGGDGGGGGGGAAAAAASAASGTEVAALAAAQVAAAAEAVERGALEARIAEADQIVARLLRTQEGLLGAKDAAEDALRALGAKAAEEVATGEALRRAAEEGLARERRKVLGLERDLAKLRRRHEELRAASKRLLADRKESGKEEKENQAEAGNQAAVGWGERLVNSSTQAPREGASGDNGSGGGDASAVGVSIRAGDAANDGAGTGGSGSAPPRLPPRAARSQPPPAAHSGRAPLPWPTPQPAPVPVRSAVPAAAAAAAAVPAGMSRAEKLQQAREKATALKRSKELKALKDEARAMEAAE